MFQTAFVAFLLMLAQFSLAAVGQDMLVYVNRDTHDSSYYYKN